MGADQEGDGAVNLRNRIKKLEAVGNKPLTQQEISDAMDWFEKEWFPYDNEAELLLNKISAAADADKETHWRQFQDRAAAHINKLGGKCPLLVRRSLL